MKVVIVGGVAGGAGCAARLRRNDESAEIVMLEKGDHISFANCGLPYYIGGIIEDEDKLLLQTPESFRKRFAVDVRVGHACTAVDPVAKTVTVADQKTGESYSESYDKLMLSPGASPIRPLIPGIERAGVFTLRNIPDTMQIKQYVDEYQPKTCAVIGGGFIGLEMAENLHHLGLRVTVIEAASHVIGPLDADMAHDVHNYLRSKGIDLLLNKKAAAFTETSVILDSGREAAADMVIFSIGVRPDTGFLAESGIARGTRGEIIVNEYLETSAPDVYAVGDAIAVRHIVSGRQAMISLASPANRQARIVADNICGQGRKYSGAQGTAIIKLFDMTVALTGENEDTLRALGTPYLKSITHSASHAGYYPGGEMMTVKLLFDQGDGRVLGAQIVGGQGVDKRMDVLATAICANLTVFDLQELELAYAPPFSSAKDPVNMAGYVAGNILEGKMQTFYIEDLASLPPDAQLLDVRSPGEYRRGSIPGAVNIPVDSLRAALDSLDQNKEYYLCCQVGLRAYIAESLLRQHGYKVKNLAGGYKSYKAAQDDLE